MWKEKVWKDDEEETSEWVKDEKGIVQIKYLYFFVYVHKR